MGSIKIDGVQCIEKHTLKLAVSAVRGIFASGVEETGEVKGKERKKQRDFG